MKEPMLVKRWPDVKPQYPCVVQIKMDGVRGCVDNGIMRGRSCLPFPNKQLQEVSAHLPHGLDGEILIFNLDTNEYEHRSLIAGWCQRITDRLPHHISPLIP